MYESVQQTPQQMAFFHLAKTCQIGLDEAPLTWKQADETYREWEKSQKGGALPKGCWGTPPRSAFQGRALPWPRIGDWHLRDGDRMRPRS
jgi:hypothetical protein